MGLPTYNEVACMNDDMLVEILTRLPLKSYSRSKCVSKTWQALVSLDYTRSKLSLIVSGVLQPSNPALKNKSPAYISNSDDRFEPASLDFFPFASDSTLIDCCNGLLLFYSSLDTTFHVCNPTTKKYVTLPKPSKVTQLSIVAFDPYHAPHFKVVSFTRWHDRSADLEIFDSQSWNWVRRTVGWGVETNTLSSMMRYMDGILYIVAQPNKVVAVGLSDVLVTCGVIELPEVAKKDLCIGNLEGRLHYCTNDRKQLKIWMLIDDDDEERKWVMKHCVSVDEMIMGDEFRVLALHPERANVVYLWANGRLIAYDVFEKRMKEVLELGNEKGYLIQVWVFPFSKYMEDCLAKSID